MKINEVTNMVASLHAAAALVWFGQACARSCPAGGTRRAHWTARGALPNTHEFNRTNLIHDLVKQPLAGNHSCKRTHSNAAMAVL
jgi:hypothetical protein